MRHCHVYLAALILGGLFTPAASPADETPAERGRRALLTQTFNPAAWKLSAYENVWKFWDAELKEPPRNYDQAFRDRYGLHPAPFDNDKFPMGVRVGKNFLGKGLTTDCLLCHGGSILGNSYVGLGNASLDVQAFFEDLGKASGSAGRTPFVFSHVRGTSEAGNMAVYLLSFREPDLTVRLKPLDLGMRDHLCEDVPAWWHLKKKKTMYHTGTSHARSVRSIMQFMNSPTNSLETMEKAEPVFADIQAFILSLEAPKYPFPIDRELAQKGHTLFEKTCAKCHGSYGEKWTYPNRIVPVDIIGTDRTRLEGFTKKSGEYYNESWFAKEKRADGGVGYPVTEAVGYQAPPLDGIWATAPYLHNGSVPTVHDVLNSRSRPKVFTRSYRTDAAAYDPTKLGWQVKLLDRVDDRLSSYERRKVYDTTQAGRGNAGHTFGDQFSEEERRAVIEYLKTL